MSMSLTGVAPAEQNGHIYMSDSWSWSSLVQFYEIYYPDPMRRAGLSRYMPKGTLISAENVQILIECISQGDNQRVSSEVMRYVEITSKFLDSLENIDCQSCVGTGRQRLGIIHPELSGGPCKECNGSKKSRPYICNYKINGTSFEMFLRFLRVCGGFIVS